MHYYRFDLQDIDGLRDIHRSTLEGTIQGVQRDLAKALDSIPTKAVTGPAELIVSKLSGGTINKLSCFWVYEWTDNEQTKGLLKCGMTFPENLPLLNLKKVNWDGIMHDIRNEVPGLKIYRLDGPNETEVI